MKILANLFDDVVLLETESFRWDLWGNDDSIPNFWWKPTNIQVQWHSDDPGRGSFANQEEFSATDVITLLSIVREEYDIWRDGK